jgi:hypothetical protein
MTLSPFGTSFNPSLSHLFIIMSYLFIIIPKKQVKPKLFCVVEVFQ